MGLRGDGGYSESVGFVVVGCECGTGQVKRRKSKSALGVSGRVCGGGGRRKRNLSHTMERGARGSESESESDAASNSRCLRGAGMDFSEGILVGF